MIAVRAAALAIALCVLSPPFTPAGSSDGTPLERRAVATFQLNSMIVRQVIFGLPRSSKLAHFAPWKARPKIVLGESDQKLPEETDLGPALLPSGLSSPMSTAPTTSRQPSLPPLRC